MLEKFSSQLVASVHLTDEQVAAAVDQLTDEGIRAELKVDFLVQLARKGETVEEIAAFVRALRNKSIVPPIDPSVRARHILDVCGTGGDKLGTFNISTTVAFICAAAGVAVAKHGNRAITSQAGSADVLEALGVRIDLPPAEAAQSLKEHHFAFFFAPNYHPAFKHISPARKLAAERGQRTIFNFLGPLLNPVHPSAQLVGVPRPELCEPIARVLQSTGTRRGMVASGSADGAYLDELSTLGENTIAEFYQERGFAVSSLSPQQFPLQPAQLKDLLGSHRKANAGIILEILRGKDRGPKRDAVLLNAAAALFVAERVRSLDEGWQVAGEIIDDGRALAKLGSLPRL